MRRIRAWMFRLRFATLNMTVENIFVILKRAYLPDLRRIRPSGALLLTFTQRFVAIFEQFDVQILIQSDTDKQLAQFAVA